MKSGKASGYRRVSAPEPTSREASAQLLSSAGGCSARRALAKKFAGNSAASMRKRPYEIAAGGRKQEVASGAPRLAWGAKSNLEMRHARWPGALDNEACACAGRSSFGGGDGNPRSREAHFMYVVPIKAMCPRAQPNRDFAISSRDLAVCKTLLWKYFTRRVSKAGIIKPYARAFGVSQAFRTLLQRVVCVAISRS